LGFVLSLCLSAQAAPPASSPAASAPVEAAAIPAGVPVSIGTTYSIGSKVLGMDRRITVRLPYEYQARENAARTYPVLYLIDGGPEQDYPHIAGIAQLSDTNPAWGEFILVGVETVNRRSEISPAVVDPAKYKDLGAVPGGSAKFRDFLRLEVMPWVKGRYRTSGRDALIGESLAGLFTMETFLREPELFDDYVAVSPSLWWEDMEYGRRAAEFLGRHGASDRSLRIYIADEGYWQEEGALKIVEALERTSPKGLRWGFFDLGDEETHKTIFHRAAFDAIRALYPVPDRTYRPHPNMSGIPVSPRTKEMEERAAVQCDLSNSRPTTPADTRKRRDATFYECVLYDYGDVPARGNLARSRSMP
ncbi:MAG TPA: alpha/beta hydrolase-fold protein, partial [Allosphingosinicella sp.]